MEHDQIFLLQFLVSTDAEQCSTCLLAFSGTEKTTEKKLKWNCFISYSSSFYCVSRVLVLIQNIVFCQLNIREHFRDSFTLQSLYSRRNMLKKNIIAHPSCQFFRQVIYKSTNFWKNVSTKQLFPVSLN